MVEKPKPRFQFSLRRLLLVIILLTAGIGNFMLDLQDHPWQAFWNPVTWALVGGGVCSIFSHPVPCAASILVVLMIVALLNSLFRELPR